MNSNHEAMLYGAIRVLENVANDMDVTLGDVNQSINDLYTVINENATPHSSSANNSEEMIYKFSDYFPKGGSNFPTGPKGVA
jgi:hypothetical protein